MGPSLTPTHPGGIQAVAPSSSATAGPDTCSAVPVPASVDVRAAADVGRPHGNELDRALAVRVAVALLVRAVEASSSRARGDCELERLPAVAEVGRAGGGQLAGLLERDEVRAHGIPPLVRDDEPERRQHAGGRRHEHRPEPELVGESARVQRPGAAEGDEREVAWIVAALDRDDPQRPQHLRVHDLDHRRRVEPVERTRGGVPVELEPARELRGQPSEQEIGVGDGRLRPTFPVARRPRLGAGARRADAQRPACVEPGDRPAAGADGLRSTVGSRTGKPPIERSDVRSTLPSAIRQTSVDVPPMSSEIAFGSPASRATRAAATAPAAGPETSTTAGS